MRYQNNVLEYLSDFWIGSGKIVTFISLLILPLVIVAYVFFTREIILSSLYFDQYHQLHSTLSPHLFYLLNFFKIFEWVAFVAILLMYPPYPLPTSSEWYFKKRGFKRAVMEYQFVKNVLIVSVPILIAFTAIGIIHDLRFPPQAVINASSPLNYYIDLLHPHIDTFNIAKILLFLIVVSGVLKMIFARVRREFWLHYTIGCFVQMQNRKNDMDEMRYFVKGLNSYNLYVRRQTKLEIKELGKFFSKIVSFEQVQKNEFIGKFASYFSSYEIVKKDTLYPLREISALLDIPKESQLLVGQSLRNRLMEWGAAAAVFIPLIIQTINFISPFIRMH